MLPTTPPLRWPRSEESGSSALESPTVRLHKQQVRPTDTPTAAATAATVSPRRGLPSIRLPSQRGLLESRESTPVHRVLRAGQQRAA